MIYDAVAHLERKIKPLAVLFQHVDDAERLLAVAESARRELGEHTFADVPEGRMPQIVPERDRLRQIFVQGKTPRERTGDLAHIKRMRQSGHVVIAVGRKEYLRLILQTQERLGIYDPVPVPLKLGAHRAGRFFLHRILFRQIDEKLLFFSEFILIFYKKTQKKTRPAPAKEQNALDLTLIFSSDRAWEAVLRKTFSRFRQSSFRSPYARRGSPPARPNRCRRMFRPYSTTCNNPR